MANKRIARHGYGHIENAESSYSIDALAERRQDECCSPFSDLSNDLFEIPNTTPNFRTELAGQLAKMVPEAVADGKLDVEKLRELLADDVADSSERFGLFWPGKKRALYAAQAPTTATLKPDLVNSKGWDTTQNVFIEGDNLEVLKILQRHYHNKVKLIYIDPPYNTGKDFVYSDSSRVPVVGWSSRPMMFSRVLLSEPDAPTMAQLWPEGMDRETPCNTGCVDAPVS